MGRVVWLNTESQMKIVFLSSWVTWINNTSKSSNLLAHYSSSRTSYSKIYLLCSGIHNILRHTQDTVSAQIERHSWLERHEAHFGHTMVIFDQKSSKNAVFSDNFWSKMTIMSSLKLIKINGTPSFYVFARLRYSGIPEILCNTLDWRDTFKSSKYYENPSIYGNPWI